MRKIITSIVLVLLFSGGLLAQPAAPAQPAENSSAGDFKFVEETWDFGISPQNKPITHEFTFTNTGKEPIVIADCKPSCGCTAPDWPKDPILPGKTAVIKVTYNAAHAGNYNKSVTIKSNAKDADKVIYIKGNIEAPLVEQTTPEKPAGLMQPATPK